MMKWLQGADYPFQPERYEWRNGVSVIGSWQVACLYVYLQATTGGGRGCACGYEIFACGDGCFRVWRWQSSHAMMGIAACGDFGRFVRLLNFFQKKTASCFVVFGKVRTFASEKRTTMLDNICITQACEGMAMPSGQHVCLSKIRSHSRCHS